MKDSINNRGIAKKELKKMPAAKARHEDKKI